MHSQCCAVHRNDGLEGQMRAMPQVWDLAQGKCVRTLTGHSRPVQRLHIASGRLYSIGGRSLRVWDLATYTCLRVQQQPRESGALFALAVAPNGTVYIAGQVRACSLNASLSGEKPTGCRLVCWPGPHPPYYHLTKRCYCGEKPTGCRLCC